MNTGWRGGCAGEQGQHGVECHGQVRSGGEQDGGQEESYDKTQTKRSYNMENCSDNISFLVYLYYRLKRATSSSYSWWFSYQTLAYKLL